MNDLRRRSVEIIRMNQAPSGAYVASPTFPNYRFCWLRDGSFIAHAMDLIGETASAGAFFRWVDRTIRRYAWKVDRILEKVDRGDPLLEGDFLHTRYTLAGEETRDQWGNFQLDGYGTWLWALCEHIDRTNDLALLESVAASVQVTARYLNVLWNHPNYDCWEERPQSLHTYTLAAVYAGINAALKMADRSGAIDLSGVAQDLPETIRRFVLAEGVRGKPGENIHLVKSFAPAGADGPAPTPGNFKVLSGVRNINEPLPSPGSQLRPPRPSQQMQSVDASLLGVALPYRMLESGNPLFQGTVARIEADLRRPQGGVYRYLGDTYYGGGEWLLLAAWLGWFYAETGDRARAVELLDWVEAQADPDGHLPEQISDHLQSPRHYAEWVDRWGPVARPLLWSHAMHLILDAAVRSG